MSGSSDSSSQNSNSSTSTDVSKSDYKDHNVPWLHRFMHHHHDGLVKAALFLAGLALLFPLRIGLNGASFCLKRFKLDEEIFSVYVNRVHNAMEMGCMIGVTLGNIYVLSCEKYMEAISIGINWITFVFEIVLLFVFISGGQLGKLTLFYWSLVASTFIYGLNQVCAFKIGGEAIVYYMAAMPISGILTAIMQFSFTRLFGDRNVYDTDLLVIAFQLGVFIFISLISACVWTLAYIEQISKNKKSKDKNEPKSKNCKNSNSGKIIQENGPEGKETNSGENKGKKNCRFTPNAISGMLMCIIGLGIIYAIYPAIAPGQLVTFQYVQKIEMVNMIVSALPSLIIAIISEATENGPNKEWTGSNSFWHGFIVFVVIEIVVGIMFIISLHYKDTALSRAILRNPLMASFLTITYFVCHIIAIGVGFPGVEANSNGTVATVNLFLSLLVMNTFELLGEGYIVEYKKYSIRNWPTDGMTIGEALKFWIRKASFNAWLSLKSSVTTDVRKKLLESVT
ncbi:Theileria-specific integral membrane protein, putative [Theileria annulata]|uniref:Theileria-specific integral membrane protein, putative n=1 Tax=Theileria annulata TaxID=5874 RepID=Q4UB73_THEAN|nr:Theileria-specific integral membrane protein, putative [Theileria annulata]CAI75928.1 Theileria-specific integral membrane protein, putative [Theileria annulata]|eukprot:XP_955404.1 Theileria-specific integral membrane protein, putative [Theileria annulata]